MQVNGHSSWHHFNNNYNLISCRECSQCPRHCAVHSGCALAHLIPIANHGGKFFYYPHFPGGHREIWKCWRSHSSYSVELSLSGLEPVFPVTLPLSDRSSCCGFLGKWHRVGKPTILSQGGLQSGGARQSYVQIPAPALLSPWPWARDWLIFSRLSLLINKVGILIIIMPVLFSCLEDSVGWCTK